MASLTVNGFREGESVGVTMSSSVPKFTKQAYEPEKKGQRNRETKREEKREEREKEKERKTDKERQK